MAKARIGYIGVGLMGLPMAARLVTRGYQVTAYDIAPDRMAPKFHRIPFSNKQQYILSSSQNHEKVTDCR